MYIAIRTTWSGVIVTTNSPRHRVIGHWKRLLHGAAVNPDFRMLPVVLATAEIPIAIGYRHLTARVIFPGRTTDTASATVVVVVKIRRSYIVDVISVMGVVSLVGVVSAVGVV